MKKLIGLSLLVLSLASAKAAIPSLQWFDTSDFLTSNIAPQVTLKTRTAGTFRSVTVNSKGVVTAGTAPTTFTAYSISDSSANLASAITDETGSGLLVFNGSPAIITPTIASFINATHNHQNAAGGGALDTAAITSGTLAAARLPALTGDVTTSAGSASTTLAAGSAANLNSGTLLAARMPALTGVITTSAGAVATVLGSFSSANLSGALTDETGTGAAVFGTAPTFTTKITTPQADYTTNSNPVVPDFTLGYQLFQTNAAFTFLAPVGVDTTKLLAQTAVVFVTNSTAAAVLVTAPANVHTQGTWYVTNVTAFTFFQYAQKFTNCIAYPLW